MMPAAIGTQVGGSIIRPAAFCGNVALKPTQGGINRGERLGHQHEHARRACRVHRGHVAGRDRDRRARAAAIAAAPGCSVLGMPPAAHKPERLIVLETAGWEELDAASKSAFEALLRELEAQGVQLLRRASHPLVEKLETRRSPTPRRSAARSRRWENRLVAAQPRRPEPGRRQRPRQGHAGQGRGHVAQPTTARR